MNLSASVPGCRSLGHGHGHISPDYPSQCSCLWLGGQVGLVAAWASCCFCTERHRNFSLECDTALRNEWGLEKTNLNKSWQRVGKERHAHNCLSNSDSFGGAGEAGAGSSWAEPETGSLSGHLPPPEVIHPWRVGGLCSSWSLPGQGCDLPGAWERCIHSLGVSGFSPRPPVLVSSAWLGRRGLICRPCVCRVERPLRNPRLWRAS